MASKENSSHILPSPLNVSRNPSICSVRLAFFLPKRLESCSGVVVGELVDEGDLVGETGQGIVHCALWAQYFSGRTKPALRSGNGHREGSFVGISR
jgi:hypothetical protein